MTMNCRYLSNLGKSQSLDGAARESDDVQRIWVESLELVWRIVGRCWLCQREDIRRERLLVELGAAKEVSVTS